MENRLHAIACPIHVVPSVARTSVEIAGNKFCWTTSMLRFIRVGIRKQPFLLVVLTFKIVPVVHRSELFPAVIHGLAAAFKQ